MEVGSAPALVSSRCRIIYRSSSWSVHQFEVWSGDIVCRVAALRGAGWLLVWVGGAEPQLSEMALGMPARSPGADGAAATALVGGDGAAPALARRLAARLSRPVYSTGTGIGPADVDVVRCLPEANNRRGWGRAAPLAISPLAASGSPIRRRGAHAPMGGRRRGAEGRGASSANGGGPQWRAPPGVARAASAAVARGASSELYLSVRFQGAHRGARRGAVTGDLRPGVVVLDSAVVTLASVVPSPNGVPNRLSVCVSRRLSGL
ncbi:hypothetical protein K1T71_004229 [Dendrolimus kikuchii]|uniref:Uncharacterized protein n=1 Tax=Dendrolimus kikuchii TaxID=765133 RepID=A0ACC1D7Q4_9NEOP|nr:hypothetical protein K1T71_004229 [Dendrolimus kikuchii]